MPTAGHVDGRQSKVTFDASVAAAIAADAEQEIYSPRSFAFFTAAAQAPVAASAPACVGV
jgi:hypothetical protein